MSKRTDKRDNFTIALQRLKEAIKEHQQEGASEVVRDGMIQRFEFTYELAWKATKEYLEKIGIADLNAPKSVFKEAFAQRLIENEETWLQILKDRNLTTHTYQEDLASEIAERIVRKYIGEFEKLLQKIG